MTKSKALTRKQAAILQIIEEFNLAQLGLAVAVLRDIESGYPATWDDSAAVERAFRDALDGILRSYGVCPAARPSNG